MYKLCNYTKEEMLQVVGEHASKNIDNQSPGVLRVTQNKDGSIEVFFIEHKTESVEVSAEN